MSIIHLESFDDGLYGIVSEYTWDDDPNTAAAWTYGNVNSAEFGAEVRDS